jgi:hypothetical protein
MDGLQASPVILTAAQRSAAQCGGRSISQALFWLTLLHITLEGMQASMLGARAMQTTTCRVQIVARAAKSSKAKKSDVKSTPRKRPPTKGPADGKTAGASTGCPAATACCSQRRCSPYLPPVNYDCFNSACLMQPQQQQAWRAWEASSLRKRLPRILRQQAQGR